MVVYALVTIKVEVSRQVSMNRHPSKFDSILEKVKENGKEVEKEIEKTVYKGSWKDFHYYQDIYNTAKNAGLLEKYGIEWGGNCWKSFKDAPHWQIKGADKVAFK